MGGPLGTHAVDERKKTVTPKGPKALWSDGSVICYGIGRSYAMSVCLSV